MTTVSRKNITIYSLRHTISTLLAEEGVSEEIRARICGHTVGQQRHYSKNARKQRLIDEALDKLENITKPRQKVSNFSDKECQSQKSLEGKNEK